jgi:hypothetical protein
MGKTSKNPTFLWRITQKGRDYIGEDVTKWKPYGALFTNDYVLVDLHRHKRPRRYYGLNPKSLRQLYQEGYIEPVDKIEDTDSYFNLIDAIPKLSDLGLSHEDIEKFLEEAPKKEVGD